MLRLMRLRTLTRFAGMLQQLVAVPAVSPFDVNLRLRELLGELAALSPDRDFGEVGAFDHDNPGKGFRELDWRIRPLLRDSAAGTFKEFKFSLNGRFLQSDVIEPPDFANGTDFLLGIQSRSEPNELTKFVTDSIRFKLSPDRVRSAGGQANVPGVKLERDYGVPPELPQRKGLNYFRLNPAADERMWKWVQEDKRLCVIWGQSERFEYESVSLFVTMQETTATAQAPRPMQPINR
jgi:predicted component of type VI protein secretion system